MLEGNRALFVLLWLDPPAAGPPPPPAPRLVPPRPVVHRTRGAVPGDDAGAAHGFVAHRRLPEILELVRLGEADLRQIGVLEQVHEEPRELVLLLRAPLRPVVAERLPGHGAPVEHLIR